MLQIAPVFFYVNRMCIRKGDAEVKWKILKWALYWKMKIEEDEKDGERRKEEWWRNQRKKDIPLYIPLFSFIYPSVSSPVLNVIMRIAWLLTQFKFQYTR